MKRVALILYAVPAVLAFLGLASSTFTRDRYGDYRRSLMAMEIAMSALAAILWLPLSLVVIAATFWAREPVTD